MGKLTAVLLAIAGGISISIQAPVNAGLGKIIGSIESAFVSFVIGSVALLFMVLAIGKGDLSKLGQVPIYLFSGGILGVIIVTIAIVVVGEIGATSLMASIFVGQIVAGIIIDHFGLFGLAKQGVDWQRLLGLGLLLLGTRLVVGKH